MKKIFIALIAIVATSFSSFADTSLKEAYDALSKIKGMTAQSYDKVLIDEGITLNNITTSTMTVTYGDVQAYRDAFIYEMENLPVRQMVVGANNMRELAAIYATPAGAGKYNVLIVTGDTLDGKFTASYGQTNAAGIKSLKSLNVIMDNNELMMSHNDEGTLLRFISMQD